MGSGTSVYAAVSLSRHYIGIEQAQEYVDLTNEQLRAILREDQLAD